jgi:solute carrier family 38 (sodium-coupled neutral amino acid transporter), member 11
LEMDDESNQNVHSYMQESQDSDLMEEQHDLLIPAGQSGSSVGGAIFNFTNCIIGAGAIGLAGAIARSGGLISICLILFFAVLTKFSLDMVIDLSDGKSYEDLGKQAFGNAGWAAVLVSKKLYAFGCLIAYIVVVKDNFSSALKHLIFGNSDSKTFLATLLDKEDLVTLLLSAIIIFPLCLLRDMTPLSNLSAVGVLSMVLIVLIIVYLFFANPNDDVRVEGGTIFKNWFELRPGVFASLGTFVFSFVSQHTVNLAYTSLRPDLQTLSTWKIVSSISIGISTMVSLAVGVFVYATFWQKTQSDLFDMYPPLRIIDIAKLLLCVSMLLTFPLPFFACRELVIVAMLSLTQKLEVMDGDATAEQAYLDNMGAMEEPLLVLEEHGGEGDNELPWWLVSPRQLSLPYHVALTAVLWSIATFLAIVAPSLGDVLDLVGCATGTVIAFILPALFSFQLRGYSNLAALILLVGGLVGSIGTVFSVRKVIIDVR